MAAAIPRNLFLKDRSTKTSRLRAALHAPGPASTSMDSGTKDSKKTSVSWSSKYKQKAKQSKATATGSEDNSAAQKRIMLSSCPKTESRHEQALPSLKKEKPSLASKTTKRDDNRSGKQFCLPKALETSKVETDQRNQHYLPCVTKGEAPRVSKPMRKEDNAGKELCLLNAIKSSTLNAEVPRPEQSKATATGSEDNSATQRRIMLSSCPKTESGHVQAQPSLKKEKPSLASKTTKKDDNTSGKQFCLPKVLKTSKVKTDQRDQHYLPCVTKGEAPHVSKPIRKEDNAGKEFCLLNATKSSTLNAEVPRPEPHLPSLTKGKESKDSKTPRKRCIPEKKVCPMNNAMRPTNLTEEKIEFYKSKYRYNPQFKYNTPVPPCIPVEHRNASDRFLPVAVELMQNTLKRYGTYMEYEKATGGCPLTKDVTENHVQTYLKNEGLNSEIDVCITTEKLSTASMGIKNGRPRLTINLSTVREKWLEGTLMHEIGTHYYRSVNHSKQIWKKDEEKFRLKPKNPTEEGFASLNTILLHPEPYLCRIALLYYAAYKASCMSFSELFKDLGTFVKDPDTRWNYCMRVKRGLTDTSRPGCYSKDQVYLNGVLRILRHRQTIDFKLLMQMGKISFEDITRLKHMAVTKGTKIPGFLKDTRQYMNHINNIMKVNRLTDEKLKKLIP